LDFLCSRFSSRSCDEAHRSETDKQNRLSGGNHGSI
jgi:hypothetical protein